jgi:2-polyprenyl-3-methyl-5-hydroxy-6-metoxy-1,4-benzoquinol methylase
MEKDKYEEVNCPLCNSSKHKKYALIKELDKEKKLFKLVKCEECNTRFLNPRIKEEFIGKYYSPEYYSYGLKISTKNWKQKILSNIMKKGYFGNALKIIESNYKIISKTKILDVGCGSASLLSLLKKKYGCSVLGYDRKTGEKEVERIKIKITNKLPKEKFDLILSWHYLEHDYYPLQTLKNLKKILKPEGRIIFQVPNINTKIAKKIKSHWWGYDPPRHLNFFSSETLNKIFTKAGFKTERIIKEEIPNLGFQTFISYFNRELPKNPEKNFFKIGIFKIFSLPFEVFYKINAKDEVITIIAKNKN